VKNSNDDNDKDSDVDEIVGASIATQNSKKQLVGKRKHAKVRAQNVGGQDGFLEGSTEMEQRFQR